MRPLQLVWAVAGVLATVVMVFFTVRADAHKVGDLTWCYMPTTLHLECIYNDEASCETARKTIADFMKKNGRSFKNAPDETGAKAIDPVCARNPDKVGRDAPAGSDIFDHGGRLRSDKGSD